MVADIEALFPRLRGNSYQVTSPSTPDYNCIAWAVGDTSRWWWPVAAENVGWPDGIPFEETRGAFEAAFASLGYLTRSDESLEQGFEKIALFAGSDGIPTHAARQLPNGRWTSKIGRLEDIEHELHDLEGNEYGSIVFIMKRPISSGG